MSKKTLYLLDSMALIYRAHFGMLRNPRMTSTGTNTSAVMVLYNTVVGIIEKAGVTHLAAVFDTPEPTHRHRMYPDYKAQREAMPEDIKTALPYVFRLFEAFNVPVIRLAGWEADDIIGTLAKRAAADGFTTFMVTPDKDYGQLVDENIFICKPGSSGDSLDTMGKADVCQKWGIERVEQVIDVLGLMGDTSDNVPGIPGVGEKTAQKLIATFGSIENLLKNTDSLKGKQKEKIEENRQQALLSRDLVVIEQNVPVDVAVEDLRLQPQDDAQMKRLFIELEFNTLGKRVFGDSFTATPRSAIGTADGEPLPNLRTITDVEHDYRCADTSPAVDALLQDLEQCKRFSLDLETTGLDARTCEIVGIAVSLEPHTGYYLPMPEDRSEIMLILEAFRPIFDDSNREIVGHHLKFDLSVLRWHNITVNCQIFDTMLAAYLTLPDLRRNMDYLAQVLLNYAPQPITSLIGESGEDQKTLREIPIPEVVVYAVEDADITLQLANVLQEKLLEMGQRDLFHNIECPLIAALVEMEFQGVHMDVVQLRSLGHMLQQESDTAAARITELAGEPVDLNSAKQLGNILFDKLQLDSNAKRTAKSGQYKTDETVLRRLAAKHEIAERILHYRMCSKLNSVYVSQLPGSVFVPTGRVHTHYDQSSIATGRIQSSGPNLQTIPIRTDLGQQIRKAFVPRDDDYLLLVADYSQIELRIAAELSQDEGLLETFRNNEDVHAATAMKIYDVERDDVTDEMRRRAKTVNFGIIYGISAFGLGERLNIPRWQAQELIDQYFSNYPGTVHYMEETVRFAEEKGYVETLTGRRRYLRDINSKNGSAKRGAERNAINSRIQGTAADLIKMAMVRIHRALAERKLQSHMLLQVHDELVFDLHRSEQESLPPVVEECMRTALPLTVPVIVEMGIGDNWLTAH